MSVKSSEPKVSNCRLSEKRKQRTVENGQLIVLGAVFIEEQLRELRSGRLVRGVAFWSISTYEGEILGVPGVQLG